MLARIKQLDARPIKYQREPSKRIVGMCRDISLLLVSVLRYKHIPARVRAGFANYFDSDITNEDHWVCEYWNDKKQRWILVDTQLDDVQRRNNDIIFNIMDLKEEDGYYTAGRVWQLCKYGKMKQDDFGYNKYWKG